MLPFFFFWSWLLLLVSVPFFVATSTWRPFFPRCTLFDLPTHRVPHFIVRLFHTGLAKRVCVCVCQRTSSSPVPPPRASTGCKGMLNPDRMICPESVCGRERERKRWFMKRDLVFFATSLSHRQNGPHETAVEEESTLWPGRRDTF